ncbi:hypothetical protein BDV25DRAFT_139429 [Aspergillus avenaceus]|uniref:Uncharacterized protein n=1 Tax=Aspergillus avenaceus TaxID=36643 RepID=A0A5N6TX66_ASPAV|nr:hypothetical protein BDV25DRAFT_139429 [Aspergillus avenaceus]
MHFPIQKVLTTLIAAAALCAATLTNEQTPWKEVLHSFKNANPTDFFHLGDDGVLRHFTRTGIVLDYAQLSPQQISQSLADSSSRYTAEENEHLARVFQNIDGRNVKGSALLNPPAHIYPTPFLSNRETSDALEDGSLLNLALNPRQECPHKRCTDKTDCTKYANCTKCYVKDLFRTGECE